MAISNERNVDMADLIVNLQRSQEAVVPGLGIDLYLYEQVADSVVISESVSATPSGPTYYASPTGGGDAIVAGFWTAS